MKTLHRTNEDNSSKLASDQTSLISTELSEDTATSQHSINPSGDSPVTPGPGADTTTTERSRETQDALAGDAGSETTEGKDTVASEELGEEGVSGDGGGAKEGEGEGGEVGESAAEVKGEEVKELETAANIKPKDSDDVTKMVCMYNTAQVL